MTKNGIVIISLGHFATLQILQERKYIIYEYSLRGLLLIETEKAKANLLWDSKSLKILGLIFSFRRKLFENRFMRYIIVFKELKQ